MDFDLGPCVPQNDPDLEKVQKAQFVAIVDKKRELTVQLLQELVDAGDDVEFKNCDDFATPALYNDLLGALKRLLKRANSSSPSSSSSQETFEQAVERVFYANDIDGSKVSDVVSSLTSGEITLRALLRGTTTRESLESRFSDGICDALLSLSVPTLAPGRKRGRTEEEIEKERKKQCLDFETVIQWHLPEIYFQHSQNSRLSHTPSHNTAWSTPLSVQNWADFETFFKRGMELANKRFSSDVFREPQFSNLIPLGDVEPVYENWFTNTAGSMFSHIFGLNSYSQTGSAKNKTIPDKFLLKVPFDVKVDRKLPDDLVNAYNDGVGQIKANEQANRALKHVPRSQTQAYWIIRQIYTYVTQQPTSFGVVTGCVKTFFFLVKNKTIFVSPPVPYESIVSKLVAFSCAQEDYDARHPPQERESETLELKRDGDDDGADGGGDDGDGGDGGSDGDNTDNTDNGDKGDNGGGDAGGNQRGVVKLVTNYKVIGAGSCGVVYEAVLNGERVALKVVSTNDADELSELGREVEVYKHLKGVQGEVIPHLLWHGTLSFNGHNWRGIATSLCTPATIITNEEKKKVLEVLREKGVNHGDVRKANFVRAPLGKLFAIDFGRSNFFCLKETAV